MNDFKNRLSRKNLVLIVVATFLLSACGNDSSPEGRMTTKIDDFKKELIDSMNKQNAALLDSLGKIREEIKQLQQSKR